MEDSNADIIYRFLQDDLSKEELVEFKNWRQASPENENQFRETKFLWEKAHLTTTFFEVSVDKEAALANVQSKLKDQKVTPIRRNYLKWAVAVFLLVVGGFALQTFNTQTEIINYATTENEHKEITLPDESKVWMNENSSLTYDANFDGKFRAIRMNGDVIFEVTPDKSRPFIVQSDELKVTVLGTKFNVFAPKKSSENKNLSLARVHVFHGKVKVTQKSDDKFPLILTKGMTAGLSPKNNKLIPIVDHSPNVHFWLTDVLIFKDKTLQQVILQIEEAYKINIDLTDEKLLNCSFTGKFENQNIDEVMEILAEVLKLDFTKQDSTNFKITGGLCN